MANSRLEAVKTLRIVNEKLDVGCEKRALPGLTL